MGLGTSPVIWMTYVNFLLDSMPDKEKVIAIMDDLLIHSSRRKHFILIENLLITMKTNGLKLSPKKSQLFMKELIYMGTLFKVQGDIMTITPLRTCIEAIQKLKAPTTVKGCKSFCGVVNYLALFCPELQKLLHPIYDLTRKGVEFYWSEQHQANFDEIKHHLCHSMVSYLPIAGGRFILYSDTSQTHTGSTMWQFQKGKPCLIGYASKFLPPACKNYSVTELEMFGLLMNMHSWNHLIGNVDFDCATDHIAVVHVMKAKDKPAKTRIQRFLGKLFRYKFNLYYVKGKDLILTDFLSCINTNDTNTSELIPILFVNMMKNDDQGRLNIVTRCGTRLAGLEMPKVHGHDKSLDPNRKPEHQKIKPVPRLAQQPLPRNTAISKPLVKPKSSA